MKIYLKDHNAKSICLVILLSLASSVIAGGQDSQPSRSTDDATSVVTEPLQVNSERQRNIIAADLQPSWNYPDDIAATVNVTSLTAEQVSQAKTTLAGLQATYADATGPKTALHKIPIESISVLGAKSGITYGAWKGGTAGSMPIHFYLGNVPLSSRDTQTLNPELTQLEEFKATLRRSAKIWSRRLVDDGKLHDATLEGGPEVAGIEGILIQIEMTELRMSGGPRAYSLGPNKDTFRPWYGKIHIPKYVANKLYDAYSDAIAHEIGHVLGVTHSGVYHFSKYYDADKHTWSGPNSMRAYGEKPVPLQWLDENRWWVVKAPHEAGARRDTTHFGVCTTLMTYCGDRFKGGGDPSDLDFAFLADIGYTVLDSKTAAETERYGYAAWGDWAAWGVGVERDLRDNFHDDLDTTYFDPDDPRPHDFTQAHADAFGSIPATVLAANSALRGKVSWKGSLLGVNLHSARLVPVVGKARLRVDLETLAGTVRFSKLTVHAASGSGSRTVRSRPFRTTQISYQVQISGNHFADEQNWVQGSFYGPAHQEMAGVVKDTREDIGLLAGFGGVRPGN